VLLLELELKYLQHVQRTLSTLYKSKHISFNGNKVDQLTKLASFHEKGTPHRVSFEKLEDVERWANLLSLQPMPDNIFLSEISTRLQKKKGTGDFKTLASLLKITMATLPEKAIITLKFDLDYSKLEEQKLLSQCATNAKIEFVKALDLPESTLDMVEIGQVSKGSVNIDIVIYQYALFKILLGLFIVQNFFCGYHKDQKMGQVQELKISMSSIAQAGEHRKILQT